MKQFDDLTLAVARKQMCESIQLATYKLIVSVFTLCRRSEAGSPAFLGLLLRLLEWRACLRSLLSFVVLAGITLCPVTSSVSAELQDPMGSELKQRAASLNPVSVDWTLRRISELPKNELFSTIGHPYELIGETFFEEQRATLKYNNQSLYVRFDFRMPIHDSADPAPTGVLQKVGEEESPLPSARRAPSLRISGYNPQAIEIACDGETYYFGDPYGLNGAMPALLAVRPLEKALYEPDKYVGLNLWRSDYFAEAGYYLPRDATELAEARPVESAVVRLASRPGAKVQSAESKVGELTFTEVTIEHNEGRSVFWLDTGKGYVVHQRKDYDQQGALLRTMRASDFRSVPGGSPNSPAIWLPYRIDVDQHTWKLSGKPSPPSQRSLFTEVFVVKQINREPISKESFVLNYTRPGTTVIDSKTDSDAGELTYVIPADAKDLDAAIQHAREGTPFTPASLGEGRAWRLFLIAINVVVVVALIAYIYYRRTRKMA